MVNSYQTLNPSARLNNFEMSKDFILMISKAIGGRYGENRDDIDGTDEA